jgi:hypothetical protein
LQGTASNAVLAGFRDQLVLCCQVVDPQLAFSALSSSSSSSRDVIESTSTPPVVQFPGFFSALKK